MPLTSDVAAVARHLRRAATLHAYELGDLDPIEAPHASWLADAGTTAVALIYRGLATPTVIALADDDRPALARLLAADLDALPARAYAHLSPGLADALGARFAAAPLGRHYKMALAVPAPTPAPGAEPLAPAHADEIRAFYALAYPGSYFEPACLTRGRYLGVRDAHGLAAIAGTHVYSPAQGVASLGSIATRPDVRGRGLARQVTAALCAQLAPTCPLIALNVRADNPAAIACYRGLGFELRHEYDEWQLTAR